MHHSTPRMFPKHRNFHQLPVALLFACLVLPAILQSNYFAAEAYMINIDAGVENECFHERVPVGVKIGFSFEVIEGGFYDIDYVIKDPNNVILYHEDKSNSAKVTIEATTEGPYSMCFSNRQVSYTPKFIMFEIERSDSIKTKSTGTPSIADKLNDKVPVDEGEKLANMVQNLLFSTMSGRQEVRHLTARDRRHRVLSELINRRIVWWCGVEFILLLVVTVGQVWYLRKFFEVRRKA